MDISIIIPSYNKLSYLKTTLRALESLDFPKDSFEVVAVDDGSQEDDYSTIRPEQYNYQLRIIHHSSNRGRAAARNSGVRESQGWILAFLDDDMCVVPEFLKAHLRHHESRSGRVVIGNMQRSPEVPSTALVRYLDSRGVHKLKPGEPVPFRYFATGNVSLERELFSKVGLFDERFREFGGEDLELGYRLHKAGAEFCYETKAQSFRTDYRDILGLCRDMEVYGRWSLSLILETHPELGKMMKVHLIEPIRLRSEPLMITVEKISFHLAMWDLCGFTITLLARSLNRYFVPNILFDYLIMFYYAKGLHQAQIARRRE